LTLREIFDFKRLANDTESHSYKMRSNRAVYRVYFAVPSIVAKDDSHIATMYMAAGRRGIVAYRHSLARMQV
jgi:formylmethanofuran dehydrogenase subunit E-like metal-binding protein